MLPIPFVACKSIKKPNKHLSSKTSLKQIFTIHRLDKWLVEHFVISSNGISITIDYTEVEAERINLFDVWIEYIKKILDTVYYMLRRGQI